MTQLFSEGLLNATTNPQDGRYRRAFHQLDRLSKDKRYASAPNGLRVSVIGVVSSKRSGETHVFLGWTAPGTGTATVVGSAQLGNKDVWNPDIGIDIATNRALRKVFAEIRVLTLAKEYKERQDAKVEQFPSPLRERVQQAVRERDHEAHMQAADEAIRTHRSIMSALGTSYRLEREKDRGYEERNEDPHEHVNRTEDRADERWHLNNWGLRGVRHD
jgi:hypothetical protein